MERFLSCDLADFVGPSVDDRVAVEVIKVGKDPLFKFGFGGHPDMAQHGAGHLGEEALHQIQPGLSREERINGLGVNTRVKRPSGRVANQALVSFEICAA